MNANSTVEPQDVLVIINELNDPRFSNSVRALVSAASLADFPNFYYDTNSDGFVAPQDALVVINFLNGSGAEGEGSGAFETLDATAVDWIFSQTMEEWPRQNTLTEHVVHLPGPPRSAEFTAQLPLRSKVSQSRSNSESPVCDSATSDCQEPSLLQEIQVLLQLK